jgi:hypothetical protein
MSPSKMNILFLLIASLLICDFSIAERGNVGRSRRELAVGDRPTKAPVHSPTHKPTDEGTPTLGDDDDGSGKGKGRPTANGDDDDGSGKGKGGPTPNGDDDDGSGKGKGQPAPEGDDDDGSTGKGYVPDDDAFYMSYPEGKGKGARPSKSKKKSKKGSKKDKSSKSDKTGMLYDVQVNVKVSSVSILDLMIFSFVTAGKPSMSPPVESPVGPPAGPPVVLPPTTPSPTSENSIAIKALPYALTYAPSSNVPSTVDFAQLAEITRLYMEEFMINEFESTSLTNLDDFLTFMVKNEFEAGEPVTAEYESTGLFNPSSIFLPTVRELNQLISEAFNDDNLPEYLQRVRNLPRSNPFSDTDEIEFSEIDGTSTARSQDTAGSFVRAGVAAAAAGVVVLAAGLAILRSQSRGDQTAEDPISPLKKLSGDSTVAEETCNMSMDGSSMARSWKTPTGFNRNSTGQEECEFEDEPLDSDDDDSSMPSRQATRTT